MTIYYLIISLLIISLLSKPGSKQRNYLFILYGVIVFFVVATRDISVGNDTEGYVKLGLGDLLYSDVKGGIEFLWSLFIGFFGKSSLDAHFFIFFTAVLEFVFLFIFIYKESSNKILSLLVFVVIVTGLCSYMTAIRQAISVGAVLLAYYCIKEKKYIPSILLFLYAIGFHATAVIGILFIPFAFLNYSKTIATTILCTSAALGFILRQDIFSAYSDISQFLTFLQMYEGYGDEVIQAPNMFGLMAIILPSTIIAFFAIKLYCEHIYTKLFVVGVVLVNLFASTPFIERYFMYVTMLQLVLIPAIYKKGDRTDKLCIIGSVMMLIVYFFKSVPYATGTDNYISILF